MDIVNQFVFLLECILPNVFWEIILGALGLSRLEELELGVETVKQRILTSTENEEQKSLLIEKERFDCKIKDSAFRVQYRAGPLMIAIIFRMRTKYECNLDNKADYII